MEVPKEYKILATNVGVIDQNNNNVDELVHVQREISSDCDHEYVTRVPKGKVGNYRTYGIEVEETDKVGHVALSRIKMWEEEIGTNDDC